MDSQQIYVPYTGGAGPDPKQANSNDKTLKMILHQSEGIEAKWNSDYPNSLWGPTDDEVLEITNPDGAICYISYDRYGFCAETTNDFESVIDMDQASLQNALKFVKEWYNSEAPNINLENLDTRELPHDEDVPNEPGNIIGLQEKCNGHSPVIAHKLTEFPKWIIDSEDPDDGFWRISANGQEWVFCCYCCHYHPNH